MKTNLITNDEILDFKMFLLKDCPIDELDDYRPDFESLIVRDIVIGYRLNHLDLCSALGGLGNPNWDVYFEYFVCQNKLMNQLMIMGEME